MWEAAVIPEQQIETDFPLIDFTSKDIGLIKFYTETAHGSQGINSYLRGAPPFDNVVPQNAQAMQDMCFKYQLPFDVEVWRGVKNDGYLPDNDMTGQTITNWGFTSTSFDESVPEQFATLEGPVGVGAVRDLAPTHLSPIIFDIYVEKGFPCIVVDALVDDPAADAEHELILPDGVKFHVVNDTGIRSSVRWITCRALPPDESGPLPIEPVVNQPESRFVGNGATMAVDDPTITAKLADFDPGEARDENGEWTGGLGGGGGTATLPKTDDKKTESKPPPRSGMHHFDESEREALKQRKIVIPPAWKNVQVADDPTSDLQAIGHDAKGRGQYLYSSEHTARQAAAKFERIRAFHDEAQKLDDALEKDAKDNDTAAAVLLMRRMGMRPGSDADTKAEKAAHGATNLRVGDVRTTPGGLMKLDFTGKDGVHIVLTVKDPDVKKAIQARLDKGKGKKDKLFDTNEGRAAAYMKDKVAGFKLKDMRTHFANDRAAGHVKGMRAPKNKSEFAKARNAVGDRVAAELGNTRTMALNSYINPAVFSDWREKIGL